MNDRAFMQRALFHAQRAQGLTTPNPMVGAVVVTPDGVVAGQGRHPRAGAAHAEVLALDEAGGRARGATLYVTLEPCRHQGRTGPCTRRIIDAGIARVVAAMPDPNPLMNGLGFADLRAAGIQVDVGLLAEEAARTNRAFVIVQTLGRPMIIVKAATSLDARIASAPGVRTEISSRQANRRTQQLRAAVDAIAVGSGTVLADDPLLTVRECYRARPLPRVIFDRRLRTPTTARLFSTLDRGPVIILTTDSHEPAAAERARALAGAGATIAWGSGELGADLAKLLTWDISCVLLEGGAEIHAAAWQAGVVDRVHLIVAPDSLGEAGVKLFAGLPVPLSQMVPVRVETIGPDAWMEADVYGHY
ncbi:MAG: bifunctional diaminohydroxyphosphoribosylaminopyrimidine deaminase/5-amino-6-(5-phosphoribosylamino)uracil reductase RibD [Vicinamibacterales bacterium]